MPSEPVSAPALSAWLATAAPEVRVDGPVVLTRFSGGHSNLTYRLDDAAGVPWVVRRPSATGAGGRAHDMGREWRFLTALAPTAVPVPRPVAFCADPDVLGAPFYVMSHVEGRVLDDAGAGHLVAPGSRRAATLALVDTLRALHSVDPDDVGLTDLRRDGGYVERQLRRWHAQARACDGVDPGPIDAVHARLVRWAAGLPAAPSRIVHGDFRFGNVAIGPAGDVRAVFDWELATVGDPLADLGWLIASWSVDGAEPIVPGPDLAGGYPSAPELVDRYAGGAGLDPALLDGYVAFARWRVACIQAGVHARYRSGAMGAPDPAADGDRLRAITTQCATALDALGG